MWFLSALMVDFLTSPRRWCPQQFPIPLCQGWQLGQTWNSPPAGQSYGPAAPAGISKGHQQNSLSFDFNKWNVILPMQKLHQLILGFCSFRWFMSLIYFFIFIYVFLFNIPENTGLAKAIQTQRTPLKVALVGTLYFHCWSSMCCLKVKDFSFHHAEASGLLLEYFPGPKWEAKLSQIHS